MSVDVIATLLAFGLRHYNGSPSPCQPRAVEQAVDRAADAKLESQILENELEAHYAASRYRHDHDYVFAHPQKGSRLDADWFRTEYANARAACGLEGRYRMHDLRHSALTNLAASGANPIAIMGTAGHRSMSTTRQYVHLAGVVFRTAADALADRLLGVVPNPGTTQTPNPCS